MKTLRTFYHSTRREFVPRVASEIAAKSKQPVADVVRDLRRLKNAGYVQSSAHQEGTIWQLTPAGKAKAEQIIRAEALARSV